MSDTVPRAGPDDPLEDRQSVLRGRIGLIDLQIGIMKTELIDCQSRFAEGDPGAIRDGARLLSDIRYWLKQAQDVETEIETYRKATTGIANEYAIDFDAARSQLRCRLDRLRACRGPKIVP